MRLTAPERLLLLPATVLLAASALPARAADPTVTLEVSPRLASVGDALECVLTVELPADTRLVPTDLGPTIGPFSVLGGRWEPGAPTGGGARHVWRGRIAAYEVGELRLPPIAVRVEGADGERVARTEALDVTIESVLPSADGSETPAQADNKGPTSIPPDYRALRAAAVILVALLALAGGVWWVVRRYADRFAKRPAPADPFHRVPPHAWVYAELQKLLDRRLAEEGQVEEFYSVLSWVLKRYLGGRYRVDLLERTTDEVVPALEQAGAPAGPCRETLELLQQCDRVKFARQLPSPETCRAAVDEAYRIVDATRPADAPGAAITDRGAA